MPIIRREELRLQYASGTHSEIYLDNHKSRSVWNTVGGNFSGETFTESPKLKRFIQHRSTAHNDEGCGCAREGRSRTVTR